MIRGRQNWGFQAARRSQMSLSRTAVIAAGLVLSVAVQATSVRGETLSSVEQRIGATTFYDLGYTGTLALLGNVEAGLTWDGHDALNDGRVKLFTNPFALSGVNYQDHATKVGGTMVCEQTAQGGPGVANGSILWTAAIATNFVTGGSFNINGNSLLYPLMALGEVGVNASGVVGGPGSTRVDVINSSWGAADDTGNTIINVIYDYLANHDGVTMVVSAGNSGQGEGKVGTPANGWNVIAVGATGGVTGTESVTIWSSGGPSGSFAQPGTRTKPDIVAPGLSISMPAYNTSVPTTFTESSGTSFAAPIVAGCAGLVIDYGKATGRSTDPRVVKSILLNSATKLTGWTQQKATDAGGTVINYTPLDDFQGAGRVDLTGAYELYSASSGNGSASGTVGKKGWDLSTVSQGSAKDYFINQMVPAGSKLTATLIWFMDRTVSGFDYTLQNPYSHTSFSNDSFDDLDLCLYGVDANGSPMGPAVAASISGWDPANPTAAATGLDSVEQLYLGLPADGRYMLRVNWRQEVFDYVGDVNTEDFALSWSLNALRPGDANGDGLVNGLDLAIWRQHYDPLGMNSNAFAKGDWNFDSLIDGADLALWQQNYTPPGVNSNTFAEGDWNFDSLIDGADPALWQQNYLAVINPEMTPEPATMMLMGLGMAVLGRRRRR